MNRSLGGCMLLGVYRSPRFLHPQRMVGKTGPATIRGQDSGAEFREKVSMRDFLSLARAHPGNEASERQENLATEPPRKR
ncbi:hypothetical protein ZHAS_00009628 [Anopheles sinensis]|uniref:Uncharacterized protein n=1 Tax=Anopheles sinensis TaxID=74873 RepID=A0A084VVQ2_ANOSI|nr:hypothetical protein ZHAS_00009628 [Anopheles sinensis]